MLRRNLRNAGMKIPLPLLSFTLVTVFQTAAADANTRLEIVPGKPAAAVRWQASVPPIVGAQAEYNLLSSSNLANWTPAGASVQAQDNAAIEIPFAPSDSRQFFVLERNVVFGEPT